MGAYFSEFSANVSTHLPITNMNIWKSALFSAIIGSHAMFGVTESSLWVSSDRQMQVISTLALYAAYMSFLPFFGTTAPSES
jgi:hypothetical protein